MTTIRDVVMLRTLTMRRITLLVLLALGCVGCGSHSSASGPSGSGTDLLIALNASANDGRTVRWFYDPGDGNDPLPVGLAP